MIEVYESPVKKSIWDSEENYGTNQSLSYDTEYYVIGQSAGYYRIINNYGDPLLYSTRMFDIVEGGFPKDWIKKDVGGGGVSIDPPGLHKPGFYEDVHEGKKDAQRIFYEFVVSCEHIDKDKWIKQCRNNQYNAFRDMKWG